MKLLTHNHMKSPAKGVNKGYPMLLEITQLDVAESEEIDEFQLEFMRNMLPSLDWEGVLLVAKKIDGFEELLPEVYDSSLLEDDSFVEAMYRLLCDIDIVSGFLICPETGKQFPIEDGIPNMM